MINLNGVWSKITCKHHKVQSVLEQNRDEIRSLKDEITNKKLMIQKEMKEATIDNERVFDKINKQLVDVARSVAMAAGH